MKRRKRPKQTKTNQATVAYRLDDKSFKEIFSISKLRKTWTAIKKELRKVSLRDSVDWIDWAYAIEGSLRQIAAEVIEGRYQPRVPMRYEVAKSRGAYRVITMPNIKDVLIYRHISDEILERANDSKVKGAYFSRRFEATPIGPRFEMDVTTASDFFHVWIRYQEYRTKTLMNKPYKILVTADIVNYFDSIQHDLLMEYLGPLGLPRKCIALLARMLEVLKPASGHSPNPRVGLPVDELDCSRQIAHVFLFEHDRRIVKLVKENNYVRWMDDQNIGVNSEARARKIVYCLTQSLGEQRLTLNASKTKFLKPEDVAKEFHLDANELLNQWDVKWKGSWLRMGRLPKEADDQLKCVWRQAIELEGHGHWDKVLKRFYAQVVRTNGAWLDERIDEYIVRYPSVATRAFDSLAKRNEYKQLIKIFRKYIRSGESHYEETESSVFESLLMANVAPSDEKMCCKIAWEYLNGVLRPTSGRPLGKCAAVLCYYWFGGDVGRLTEIYKKDEWVSAPDNVVRMIMAVTFASKTKQYRKLLPYLVGHPSNDVGRLAQFCDDIENKRINYLVKFAHEKPRWPLRGKCYDVRTWLCYDMMARYKNKKLISELRTYYKKFDKLTETRQERRKLQRIKARIY